MEGCIFCGIARGIEKSYTIYRGRSIVAFLDKYPVSKGHTLVIPEDHYESVHDTPPQVAAKVWVAASAIASYFRNELGAPAVNVLTNSGKYAGQVIFHFHVHVIPRWEPMKSFWGGRRVLTDPEASEVLDMLKGVEKKIEEYLGAL
ncbi:MAG: HIT family protein [Aeropyrum sp.]|nr:HIT family protein [Aeropyrum sp.]